jgi:hypothetical protein
MTRWRNVAFLVVLAIPAAFAQEPPSAPAPTLPSAASPQNLPSHELIVDGKPLGQAVAPRASDICIVCKRPIGTEGVVYLVDGQRVPLHIVACYNAFARNPRKFLATLQPHGAFLGTGGEGQDLSLGWFLAGLYVLLGLVFAALCAQQALHAGRSPAAWFAAGFVLNAFGFLLLLTRPKREVPGTVPQGLGKVAATQSPQACPACGSMNHPAARRCTSCGKEIQSSVSSEVEKAGLRSN